MVRRDEATLSSRLGSARASCCTSLAGVSPVPVGVGAPGSRPQVFGGDPFARAGCRKPVRRLWLLSGEQARGPQHEVNPAASSESQSGSRAAHVTVKATSSTLVPKRVVGSGGVRGAARVHRGVWNSRGPSRLPLPRRGGSYKPRAKSSAAERESEGIVVLLSAWCGWARRSCGITRLEGRVPAVAGVADEGKREGMAGSTGLTTPWGVSPMVEARELRRRLWVGANWSYQECVHAAVQASRGWRPVEGVETCFWAGWVMPRLERPSVSRVREIRTHGLNGGLDYHARRKARKE